MAHVARTITLNAAAADVWAAIGDFHGLHNWHPAVQGSTAEEGGALRRLDLGGGAEIVERSFGSDGMSYGYSIVSGPLPVENYRSVLTAVDLGGQTLVVWTSTFDATGDGAEAAIAGVYDGGFAALAEKFGA